MNQKYIQIADWTFLLLQRAGKSVSSWLWIDFPHLNLCRKAPVKSSPQSEVPQTARSWWPSPLGCRSWRTEPKSSPDRWPSQGTHTPCYRSMACTSPVRRQNSPTGSKHTHTHTRTLHLAQAAPLTCDLQQSTFVTPVPPTQWSATDLSPCRGQEWLWTSSISSTGLVCSQSYPQLHHRSYRLLFNTKQNKQ